MFNLTFRSDHFTVDRTVCKVIVLRNQNLGATQEPQPAFIVFFGERADNPGKSITNAIERLAQTVYEAIVKPSGVRPWEVCWIECYENQADGPVINMDMVGFAHDRKIGCGEDFSDPKWTPVKSDNPFIKEVMQNGRV